MIAGDVIADVRKNELHDDIPGAYRWTDGELLDFLTFAQQEAHRYRPDLFLDEDGDMTRPVKAVALETVLPGDEMLLRPLSFHVCSQALSADGSDEANIKRGGEYVGRFLQALVGGGTQ